MTIHIPHWLVVTAEWTGTTLLVVVSASLICAACLIFYKGWRNDISITKGQDNARRD